MALHILIADDEKPARDKTIRFINRCQPDARISEAENGSQALDVIQETPPDLVFLDIQMPGMTGFDVIEQLPQKAMPPVIFTTAYDEYAVRAFDVHAVDYLLKPFDFERFKKAFQRAIDTTSQDTDLADKIDLLVSHVVGKKSYADRIMVKEKERTRFIDSQDIRFIRAQGKYLEIHARESEHLIRKSMQAMLDQLDPDIFFRIHKSHVVNINHIKELQTLFHGDHNIVLTDGTELRMSRNYSRTLLARMG